LKKVKAVRILIVASTVRGRGTETVEARVIRVAAVKARPIGARIARVVAVVVETVGAVIVRVV
jgi:hypothetical protein